MQREKTLGVNANLKFTRRKCHNRNEVNFVSQVNICPISLKHVLTISFRKIQLNENLNKAKHDKAADFTCDFGESECAENLNFMGKRGERFFFTEKVNLFLNNKIFEL